MLLLVIWVPHSINMESRKVERRKERKVERRKERKVERRKER
jgi:hypothetical protein